MKRSSVVLLFVIILERVVCAGAVDCYVCEAEYDEIICKAPNKPEVSNRAVFCAANLAADVWCSTTVYHRNCTATKELGYYTGRPIPGYC